MSTIAHYPTYVRFFSTAEKLSLGGLPFVVATRSRRAATGSRTTARSCGTSRFRVRQYERVTSASSATGDGFVVHSESRARGAQRTRRARGRRRDGLLRLAELSARARRGSAARHARVSRGARSVRPGRRRRRRRQLGGRGGAGSVALRRARHARALRADVRQEDQAVGAAGLRESREGGEHRRAVGQPRRRDRAGCGDDHVAARRGAAAGRSRLRDDGLRAEHGSAARQSACRSTRRRGFRRTIPRRSRRRCPDLFIAGVVVAGFDANKVFIENGRYHGDKIVARLTGARAPSEPKLSAELDT